MSSLQSGQSVTRAPGWIDEAVLFPVPPPAASSSTQPAQGNLAGPSCQSDVSRQSIMLEGAIWVRRRVTGGAVGGVLSGWSGAGRGEPCRDQDESILGQLHGLLKGERGQKEAISELEKGKECKRTDLGP